MNPLLFNSSVTTQWLVGAVFWGIALLSAGPSLAATNIAGPSGTCVSSCSISQSAGTLSGANLFHSFTKFSIGSGDTVTFSALPATTINNVFSRVTGGTRSSIEGTLSLEAGAGSRNFFLINPAGITFSAGATIDVPGAFHATTADYVKFPDGNFYADPARASTFSSAAPEAFGFFGTHRGTVELAGAVLTTAGPIDLVAGDITINGGGISNSTGDVRLVAAGNQITEIPVSLQGEIPEVNGNLDIYNATVVTETFTGSAGGNITLAAGSVAIDYSWVRTVTSGSGRAGDMSITTGSLDVTYLSDVGSLTAAGSSGDAGNVSIVASGDVLIDNSYLRADTDGAGKGGTLTLAAANLTVDHDSFVSSDSLENATGAGGALLIDVAGLTKVTNDSWISADTRGTGNGGLVSLVTGSLFVDGGTGSAGISSDALEGSSGNGGMVSVVVMGDGEIIYGGRISTLTDGTGNAGLVYVSAKNLTIDAMGSIPDDYPTGVFSTADTHSTGDAGWIVVAVDGTLRLAAGGRIATTAKGLGYGSAGAITITAGDLVISGAGSDYATGVMSQADSSRGGYSGSIDLDVKNSLHLKQGGVISTSTGADDAGPITIMAASIELDGDSGIYSNANDSPISYGDAGNIDITTTGHIAIRGGAYISSDTESVGNAGSVSVRAGSMTIDGQGAGISYISSDAMSSPSSYGNGGSVAVMVSGRLSILNGASISSDTYDVGNAGSVLVKAGSLIIDRQDGGVTGIYSDANYSSLYDSGNAGNVDVTVAGQLSILNGGRISSRTDDYGNAGYVRVTAGNLLVSGISATNGVASSIDALANVDSSGQTGSVEITVANATQLMKGAEISIRNEATVANPAVLLPTTLTITSPDLSLNNSTITAASTGNIAASNIVVNSSGTLYLDPSQITTSSNLGNGGSIFINGGDLVWLDKSQITTSVFGLTGNGGDINITAENLVLSTGFIQANTAAVNASGGNILLSTRTLMPSGGMLSVGGSTPYTFNPNTFGYNVIQAAAPDGVSGSIAITSPTIDLSGSLAGMNVRVLDSGGLGRNPCQASHGNSLSVVGRGGLPLPAGGPLRVEMPVSIPASSGRTASLFNVAALGCMD